MWHLLIHSSIRKLSYIRFVFFMVIIRKWTCCVQENDIIFFTLTCWISWRHEEGSIFETVVHWKLAFISFRQNKTIDERNIYAAFVFHSNRLSIILLLCFCTDGRTRTCHLIFFLISRPTRDIDHPTCDLFDVLISLYSSWVTHQQWTVWEEPFSGKTFWRYGHRCDYILVFFFFPKC